MALDAKTVEHIASLARLTIEPQDIAQTVEQLSKVLAFVEQMSQLDTRDVLPLAHPYPLTQVLRPDVVSVSDQREVYQQLTEQTADGLYLVPQVIE